MDLPAAFQFSQSNLQDFETCPRRFELRYLRQLRWPAVESEPIQEAERLAQLGADFHRLVQQHLTGIEEAALTASLGEANPDLSVWWQNYLRHFPSELIGARLYPEMTLSTPLGGVRLLARFDLLATLSNGICLIVDWKTSLHRPGRDELARRLQTRVYPYVLVRAGAALNGGETIAPAAIQMLYWYPASPDRPERFEYNLPLLQRDEQFLSDLIDRVKQAVKTNQFPLVADSTICTYCVYRSFCERGKQAGPLANLPDELPEVMDVSALDWEQIAEIQF